jgi:hypothetical protein
MTTTARQAAALVVVALLLLVGVATLREATEYRGGSGTSAQTTVVFTVKEKNLHHGTDLAATTLWRTCISTIGWDDEVEPVRQDDGGYRAALRPSLPADTRRRLRGCLEDLTLDRVTGTVVTMHSGAA